MGKLRAIFMEPGLVKTPCVAMTGWATWANLRGWMEAMVLICTLTIVFVHASTAVARKLCVRRLTGLCGNCPLRGSLWCPKGLSRHDE